MRRVSSSLIAAGFTPSKTSSEPLHRQLYLTIREQILGGALKGGDRLPSTRALGHDLHVGRNTVTSVFEQLAAEGYLETEMGSGTYVAMQLPVKRELMQEAEQTEEHAIRWSRWAKRMAPEKLAALTDPGFRPFQPGLPDLGAFPTHVWTRLLQRAGRSPSLMGYASGQGYFPLRKAIATYLSVARGVRCDAEQVMIVSGTQQALDLIVRLLLDAGDSVLVENPGYFGAQAALRAAGARMVPVVIEGSAPWEIPVKNARCRLAYLTPSNQFPTGISMSAVRRLEWLEWARETGAYIVEDDYDGEFRYSSRPLPSLQSRDTAGRVIYVGSFSKLMFPSLRLGYLVLPRNMVPAFWTAKTITALSTSLLQQATLAEFIEQGHFGRHIRRMRILYKERLRVITEALRREVGDELVWKTPEAGMHICVKFLCKADDVVVSSALQAAGIGAMPLSAFYIRRAKAQGLVLGFAGYTPRAIQAGVRNLAQVVKATACRGARFR